MQERLEAVPPGALPLQEPRHPALALGEALPPGVPTLDPVTLRLIDDAVLRTMYRDAPVGIAVLDRAGRYVHVNQGIARRNGPSPEEHVGRTLEDVLGPHAPPVRRQLDRVLATGSPVEEEDVQVPDVEGVPRTWRVTWFAARNGAGEAVAAVCVAFDVTDQRLVEAHREAAERRTRLLARSSELLAAGLSVEQALDTVVGLLVPDLGDWCAIHLVVPGGGVERVRAVHRDPARPAEDLLDEGVCVPLRARGRTLGTVSVGTSGGYPARPGGDGVDLPLVEDVVARAALALDNARLFEQQREVAVTLQRSLLPRRLPRPPGVQLASRYLPGADGTEVGGDFYDAVELPGGRLGLTVGDVMGRGVRAAAVMGQIRAALRGYALEGHAPDGVLHRVDALVEALEDGELVTAVHGVLDLAGGRLRLASAGHPAPVHLHADGSVTAVRLEPGPPLGVGPLPLQVVELDLAPGDAVLLFTDGLVEDRSMPVFEGVDALTAALRADPARWLAPADRADAVCSAALRAMGRGPDHDDDIALLAVHRTLPARPGS